MSSASVMSELCVLVCACCAAHGRATGHSMQLPRLGVELSLPERRWPNCRLWSAAVGAHFVRRLHASAKGRGASSHASGTSNSESSHASGSPLLAMGSSGAFSHANGIDSRHLELRQCCWRAVVSISGEPCKCMIDQEHHDIIEMAVEKLLVWNSKSNSVARLEHHAMEESMGLLCLNGESITVACLMRTKSTA